MTYIVAVYDCGQRYGGPEEGGWWYDAGSLVRPVLMTRNEETAYAYRLVRRSGWSRFAGCVSAG